MYWVLLFNPFICANNLILIFTFQFLFWGWGGSMSVTEMWVADCGKISILFRWDLCIRFLFFSDRETRVLISGRRFLICGRWTTVSRPRVWGLRSMSGHSLHLSFLSVVLIALLSILLKSRFPFQQLYY